jgi:NAD(P)H dehydrogenase (quinone)
MRLLIVHAHPEPSSFNAAMTRQAVEALQGSGQEVVVSDLYATRFDPVSDRRNFTGAKDRSRFSQQVEEAHASATDGYVAALQTEMDRVAWCTDLVLQFPLWWLGMPAILKGWVDRVFAVGRAYGGGRRFTTGVFAGKRAMCAITVGGSSAEYAECGFYRSMDSVLFPIHRGILGFVGFTVLEPFVVFGPQRMRHEERVAELARYRERVLHLASGARLA